MKNFVFVVPLRNPDDIAVNDYSLIEALLKSTIRSLLSDPESTSRVLVVCHRTPAWAQDFAGRVVFLTVGHSRAFESDATQELTPVQRFAKVRVDKGIRHIVGTLVAHQLYQPDFIMPFDADDYVHKDLISFVRENHVENSQSEGYVIVNGVEAMLDIGHDPISVKRAFKVAGFDKLCGSCRIFDARKLTDKLTHDIPDYPTWQAKLCPARGDEVELPIPSELSDAVMSVAQEHLSQRRRGIVFVAGSHVRQFPPFHLQPLAFRGAAKGCGHGNHTGSNGGRVHWKQVRGWMSNSRFTQDFGLS